MTNYKNESSGSFLCFFVPCMPVFLGLPWWLSGKESTCSAGDVGSTPGPGRSPGEGNDNPLQYSSLENFMERGAWWVAVHGVTVAKSQTQLSTCISSVQFSRSVMSDSL